MVLQLKDKLFFFVVESSLMKLMMYIENDLIEAINLDDKSIPLPGYVGSIKRCLKMKYKELILQCPKPPEFLVVNPIQPDNLINNQSN